MDIKHKLYLREGTSDIPTYRQIFQEFQYDIPLGFEPKTIIDCGANIGLGSVYFKNRFPDATIIAIEPEHSNFELLKRNTEKYEDIHCIRAGVWHSDAHLEITNIATADKWDFMTEERSAPTKHTIPAISIDSITAKYGLPGIDVLKVDIEGSEKELFEKNYENWLPMVKVLIIELHDRMREGCTRSVFKAVSGYPFTLGQKGENLVFFFSAAMV